MVVRLHRCDEWYNKKYATDMKVIHQIYEEGGWEEHYGCSPSPQQSGRQLELPPVSLLRCQMVDRQ